ncbi:MAG: hypothetical protein HAW66_10875 [Shewanella sp.]|nr:hypothetical protein [Shewanella sp.]
MVTSGSITYTVLTRFAKSSIPSKPAMGNITSKDKTDFIACNKHLLTEAESSSSFFENTMTTECIDEHTATAIVSLDEDNSVVFENKYAEQCNDSVPSRYATFTQIINKMSLLNVSPTSSQELTTLLTQFDSVSNIENARLITLNLNSLLTKNSNGNFNFHLISGCEEDSVTYQALFLYHTKSARGLQVIQTTTLAEFKIQQ